MRIRMIVGGVIWAAAVIVILTGGFSRAAEAAGWKDAAGDPGHATVPPALLDAFQRPTTVPFPATNPYTPEKAALGERLFHDPRLSGANDRACSSCHRPDHGFEDGLPTGAAIDGTPLARRVPTVVNGAWPARFFWDGRATSLEAQALGPIQNPREMNQNLTDLVTELRADDALAVDFAEAFPNTDPALTAETLAQALATFERTIVSGVAPFDRWVAGDTNAVPDAAKRGFMLFNGKAGCVSCHSGWDFSDGAFHDIGLAGDDPGRGKILDMPEVDHAFKTPTLRDLPKRGPYMHNGALPTLKAVVDHYVDGTPKPADRPTLSPDLPDITLTPAERADLVAFLRSLDGDAPPPPFQAKTQEPVTATLMTPEVSQRNKAFTPGAVKVAVGQPLRILNDDTRDHNVRVDDPRHTTNSGYQEPGETVELAFPEPGTYHAFCGIHPKMELVVEVVEEP